MTQNLESSQTPEESRIQELVRHYTKSPQKIEICRAVFTALWYLWLREIPPSILSQNFVQDRAMKRAAQETQNVTRKLLALRPLQIDVSPQDLQEIQSADNNMFFMNHQGSKDIPYACQMLWEILGTHANTHFIMKPSVPAAWIFEYGGGIILKRGKDLKKEKKTGKIDNRSYLLNPRELPQFLEKFMETPGRNIVIYSQWTRAKWGTLEENLQEAFHFSDKVLNNMQSHVDSTPNSNHVCIALDYRRDSWVHAAIKVLKENEKQQWKLWDTVNEFLGNILKQKV